MCGFNFKSIWCNKFGVKLVFYIDNLKVIKGIFKWVSLEMEVCLGFFFKSFIFEWIVFLI